MMDPVNPIYRRRLWVHRIGIGLSFLAMIAGVGFLGWILVMLVIKGFAAVNLAMFTQNTPGPGSPGGLLNAIVGSILMVGVGTLISTPIGILAGIYLAEYGEVSWFAKVTRFVTDIMLSAPSIVIGLFVYAIYIATHIGDFSGWAGSFAISLIAIPVIVRTTDNMLNLVPTSLREAAFALGAPRWKVVTMVRLRAVKSGIVTGVLLAVARISGETAPLLFTAMGNQFFSVNMNRPMASLPLVINNFAMSSDDIWISLGWGGALLITFGVLALNILSRVLSTQKVAS
jgi:phosphate transport system permease protein